METLYPRQGSVFSTAAARDSDGRFVVAGAFVQGIWPGVPQGIAVGRYTASGKPDSTFGSAGAAVSTTMGPLPSGFSALPQVVTPLPDGAVLVAGTAASNLFVERFAADGTLDRSFGAGGLVKRSVGLSAGETDGSVLALKPLADGTLVFVHTAGQPAGALSIEHLSPAGAKLSQTVYSQPEWQVGAYTGFPTWHDAHVFPNGSVLTLGTVSSPYTAPCPCALQGFILRRFNPDGSVDTSFGTGGGMVATGFSTGVYAETLDVGDDGRIVVSGTVSNTTSFLLARYLPDGTLDKSFGQGGSTTLANPPCCSASPASLAVAPDGSVFSGTDFLAVVKLDKNGTPDARFGSGGTFTTPGGGWVIALFPEPDGGVIASLRDISTGKFELVRLTAAGALDPDFGTQSIAAGVPPPSGALALATSGSKVALAGFGQDNTGRTGIHVAVLDRGGPANGFGASGEVTLAVGDTSRATAAGIDAAGRIVVGGDATVSGVRRWIAARFRVDGTPDPGFGANGIVRSTESGADDGVAGLVVLPDSRVLLLVRQGGRSLLVRLAADGSLDRGFGDVALPSGSAALAALPGGRVVVAADGLACAFVDAAGEVTHVTGPAVPSATPGGIEVQRNGEIVVAGTTSAGIAVARRLAGGALDPSFGNGGIAVKDGVDAVGLSLQRDGRIDVAVNPRTGPQLAVVRFLYTGELDSSFGKNGLAGALDGGVTSAVAGDILVAGTVPSPRGTDFGLAGLYEQPLTGSVGGVLYHVTPQGAVRRVGSDETQPAWSPAAGRLADITMNDGTVDVAVRHGSARRLITDSPLADGAVVDGSPQWSRDGRLLAVLVLDAQGHPEFAVFHAAGGQPLRLVHAHTAAWAGAHELAFATDGDVVEMIDADTGRIRRVAKGWTVVPSPDGHVLAVSGDGWSLVRPNGRVIGHLPTRLYDPRWAPDGRHLSGFDRLRLAIVDLKGHERRLPIHAGEEARAPVWSLDGRLIAFVNKAHGDYFLDFVNAATGEEAHRWVPGGGFEHADPAWDATGVYVPEGS
jgi:uncharacterized delta-60 repeat protein